MSLETIMFAKIHEIRVLQRIKLLYDLVSKTSFFPL